MRPKPLFHQINPIKQCLAHPLLLLPRSSQNLAQHLALQSICLENHRTNIGHYPLQHPSSHTKQWFNTTEFLSVSVGSLHGQWLNNKLGHFGSQSKSVHVYTVPTIPWSINAIFINDYIKSSKGAANHQSQAWGVWSNRTSLITEGRTRNLRFKKQKEKLIWKKKMGFHVHKASHQRLCNTYLISQQNFCLFICYLS